MNIRIADYRTDLEAIRSVRFRVFVDEQNVPAEIEMDDRDLECVHLLAVHADGQSIGTARIDLDDGGRIGRVAVLAAFRRRGIGEKLMHTLHEIAIQHGLEGVWCHAQVSAVPFYRHLGYHATGETFVEAGIEHITMRKLLSDS